MANRVNLKLLFILGGSLVLAVAAVGGLYYYREMSDPVRYAALGDAATQAGDYREARSNYARALARDATNHEYYEKLVGTLRKIRPLNRNEAEELYSFYVTVLRHGTTNWPRDPNRHLELIQELYNRARFSNAAIVWDAVANASSEMLQRIPEEDSNRAKALMYRGTSKVFRNAGPAELEDGVNDLMLVLGKDPANDLAAAGIILSHLQLFEKYRFDGAESLAKVEIEEAATRARVFLATNQGPETARAALLCFMHQSQWPATKALVTTDHLLASANTLVARLPNDRNQWVLRDSTVAMQVLYQLLNRPQTMMEIIRGIVNEYHAFLTDHPDNHLLRLSLARLYMEIGEMSKAVAISDEVIASETMPMSMLTEWQFVFRQKAAALQVDVAFQRWRAASASGSDTASSMLALEATRDRLFKLLDNPSRNADFIRAEGLSAFTRGQFSVAVGHFERLLREFELELRDSGQLLLTLQLSSRCLENLGETGAALERANDALKLAPNSPELMLERARLLLAARNYTDAEAAIKQVRSAYPDHPQARELETLIVNQRAVATQDVNTADPVVGELIKVQQAVSEGDADRARGIVLAAIRTYKDDVRVWLTAAQLMLTLQDREQAREYFTRAKELQPNHPNVAWLEIVLRNESPIQQMVEVIKSSNADEGDKAGEITINAEYFVIRYEQAIQSLESRLASASGEDREKFEAELARNRRFLAEATEVIAEYKPIAERLKPNSSAMIEHKFRMAVTKQDWTTALAVVEQARQNNTDQANGKFYQGRLHIARNDYRRAAEVLEEALAIRDYSAVGWRGLGTAYRELGRLPEAERAFERAYRANPADSDVIKSYADVLLLRGNRPQALLLARQARQLQPNDKQVREVWLRLEAAEGDDILVLTQRRKIFKEDPKNVDNAIQLLAFIGQIEPSLKFMIDESGTPSVSAVRWAQLSPTQQQAAIDNLRQAWQQESEKLLAAVRQELGDTLEFAIVHSSHLRSMDRVAEGLDVLKRYVDKQPPEKRTVHMMLSLAEYFANMGLMRQAVEVLESVKPQNENEQLQIAEAFGRLLVSQNNLAAALPYYEQLATKREDRQAKLQVVELLAGLGRFSEANDKLNELIGRNPAGYVETSLKATIAEGVGKELLAAGRTREADARFAEFRVLISHAHDLDPSNPAPFIRLADFLVARYDQTVERELLDEAIKATERADEIRAGIMQTSLARANIFQRLGDPVRAISELTRALDRQPASTMVRQNLLRALIQQRQFDTAAKVVTDAIKLYPTLPEWHEALGDLQVQLRNVTAARAAYGQAFALSDNVMYLVKYVESCLVGDSPDPKLAIAQLEKVRNRFSEIPLLWIHYAQANFINGDKQIALDELKLCFDRLNQLASNSPSMPSEFRSWFYAIAQLYGMQALPEVESLVRTMSDGTLSPWSLRWLSILYASYPNTGQQKSVEYLTQAIAAWPERWKHQLHDLYLDLGGLYLREQRVADAVAAFQRAVELKPDQADALNNIAYLLVVEENNPQRALPFAQKAVAIRPGDASILDTLGWVYFKLGDSENAKQYLQRSLDRRELPETHLHIAHVFMGSKDWDRANYHIRKAETLASTEEIKTQVQELNNELRRRRLDG